MGKLYCIIGKLASGKSTVRDKVCEAMPHITPLPEHCTANLSKGSYIAVARPNETKALKKLYGENNVIVIMITVNDGIRLMRAVSREMMQENPDYNGLCEKYLADEYDFKDVEYDYSFANENVFECVAHIRETIKVERKANCRRI